MKKPASILTNFVEQRILLPSVNKFCVPTNEVIGTKIFESQPSLSENFQFSWIQIMGAEYYMRIKIFFNQDDLVDYRRTQNIDNDQKAKKSLNELNNMLGGTIKGYFNEFGYLQSRLSVPMILNMPLELCFSHNHFFYHEVYTNLLLDESKQLFLKFELEIIDEPEFNKMISMVEDKDFSLNKESSNDADEEDFELL